ncbi:MAG: hypothetical protein PHX43_00665, partial [Alphaproteobacteria bacterium]|nr:hypothetical protein [Alphaproteobacteria bacterium]
PPAENIGEPEKQLIADLNAEIGNYSKNLQAMEYRKAMRSLRTIWSIGNGYFDATAPWKLIKEDIKRAAVVMNTSVNLARLFATLSKPVIPQSAERIGELFASGDFDWTWPKRLDEATFYKIQGGEKLNQTPILFTKISPEEVMVLEKKYSGVKNRQKMITPQNNGPN